MDRDSVKSENERCFTNAIKKILKGRKLLCDSLSLIQSTPALDKKDVEAMSESIDSVDRAIAKLRTSYEKKTEWDNK